MIYRKDINTAFVLIPKNASTSIRQGINGVSLKLDGFLDHFGIQEAIDQNILDTSTKFISIIRDPFERQVSLYIYRHRQKRYTSKMSPDDFRRRVNEGNGAIPDHPWQMRLQKSFVEYDGDVMSDMWDYRRCNELLARYGVIVKENVSHRSVKNTSQLVDVFYDAETKNLAEQYWYEDILLYERVKAGNTTSGG